MAGLRRGAPGRLTGPCGAAGAARVFPPAAAGKLIQAGSGGGTVPPGGRAAGLGVLCSSPSLASPFLPDPAPAPGSGSCCSRPDTRFSAPPGTPRPLPSPGAGAKSRRSRERSGHGEGCAGSAGCRGRGGARPGPRGAAGGGIGLHPGAARERVPAGSGRPPAAPGDVRGDPAAAAFAGGGGDLGRGNAGDGAAPPGAVRTRGHCGSRARAARQPHAPAGPARRPPARMPGETHGLSAGPSHSHMQARFPRVARFPPPGRGAGGGRRRAGSLFR